MALVKDAGGPSPRHSEPLGDRSMLRALPVWLRRVCMIEPLWPQSLLESETPSPAAAPGLPYPLCT